MGSGFGGAVTAARLAERGMRVLVLERGPWWGPGGERASASGRRPYPRGRRVGKLLRNVRLDRGRRSREKVLNRDGLFEVHVFDRLLAVTGSGVGGGSHVYTNIQAVPPAPFFESFPPEITAEEMAPHYERVRRMLRPVPLPRLPEKNVVFDRATRRAGLGKPEYPDLAVAFGDDPDRPVDRTNAVGVRQETCRYCGTCFLGCEYGAKTTLDLTYVPLALRSGAAVRPLCEVRSIARGGRGWEVRYRDHGTGRRFREVADRVVLAAGTLNTLRLLFRARAHTLPTLPPSLGRRFSPNGDMAGLALGTRALRDGSRGPSLNAYVPRADGAAFRYLVGEMGLPLQALPLPQPLREQLARTAVLVGMGRDPADAAVWAAGGGLRTSASRSMDPSLFDRMERTMAAILEQYLPGGAPRVHWPFGPGSRWLATVHPLGGASIGETVQGGVVDHRGQVFGHRGLYVADGSLYPVAPGVPPSMTIAALAERISALMT